VEDQKKIFLQSEGDMWFERNKAASVGDADPILNYFINRETDFPAETFGDLLEIGCAEGKRLSCLSKLPFQSLAGIEPSVKAVEMAVKNNRNVVQGTADKLPFDNGSFDYIVFAWCLYLCDRDDLFLIAAEANRVLKDQGRIIIYDFAPNTNVKNTYKHCEGVVVHKMNHADLFSWNPDYVLEYHQSYCNDLSSPNVVDLNDQVGISVLRKYPAGFGYANLEL